MHGAGAVGMTSYIALPLSVLLPFPQSSLHSPPRRLGTNDLIGDLHGLHLSGLETTAHARNRKLRARMFLLPFLFGLSAESPSRP